MARRFFEPDLGLAIIDFACHLIFIFELLNSINEDKAKEVTILGILGS